MILRGHHGSGGLSPGSGTHARDYGATIRVRRAGAPARHGRQSNNFATGLARKRKFNRGLLAAALCVALPATSAFAIGATPLSKDAFERGLSTPAARADGLYRPDGVVDTLAVPGYVAARAAPDAMAHEFIAARNAQLGARRRHLVIACAQSICAKATAFQSFTSS